MPSHISKVASRCVIGSVMSRKQADVSYFRFKPFENIELRRLLFCDGMWCIWYIEALTKHCYSLTNVCSESILGCAFNRVVLSSSMQALMIFSSWNFYLSLIYTSRFHLSWWCGPNTSHSRRWKRFNFAQFNLIFHESDANKLHKLLRRKRVRWSE